MKTKLMTVLSVCALFLSVTQAQAGEEDTFRALGRITESPSDHTTKHEHELKFVRLSDGEVFDVVDSPDLVKAHCESEKNSVMEVEGYRTGKFLFWGGNLVVKSFKLHDDVEVPKMAHLKPAAVSRPTHNNPRL